MAYETLYKRFKGMIGPTQLNFAIDRCSVSCTEYIPDDELKLKIAHQDNSGADKDDDETYAWFKNM